ncbi:class II myosin [Coemansia sp. RSA 552]|nr:class II myosin [Coemansia sp. RSA 552]
MSRGARPKKADWSEGTRRKKQAGVSDMTMLSEITDAAINDNLKKRFQNADIYTYIGNVLISVNPFKDLGIYTPQILKSYENKNRMELAPHVYAIAEGAYRNMIAYSENQCVIISGESGAGKTEAAKKIMEYIAAVSGGNSSSIKEIKEMVLATNPLLESFGCAKTLRNNNSSRHGKYLEIQFNAGGEPVGAMVTNYLLEKGRVVGQIKDERNFHIFYQFAKAASQQYRDAFGISGPESYLYTSTAGCLDVPHMDDAKEYADTIKAMNVIGITSAEQDDIHRMLATILWLGNVQFVENADGNSEIDDPNITNFIAYLLECGAEIVNKVLVSRTIETSRGNRRGSVYDVPLNIAQANSARDGLAKAIYTRLFDWIVLRVNKAMQARSEGMYIIGVLDIYGFEIFEQNSFEQMCINYVNEKLQQIFIELTLKSEQEEYVREQIEWEPIKFFNNKVVCDLIEAKRPPGVFAAMNDACATAHADPKAADQSLSQRLTACSHSKHFALFDGNFTVKHYAGDVTYSISGMTDKNKDQLLRDHLDLCKSSSNAFLQTLFPEDLAQDSKKRPPTASDRIKASANELVTKLMQSQPSYIRTIKPNENKSPSEFDDQRVRHQVKYLGLRENIRIRRAGFAYRQTFEKFVERFYLLSPKTSYAGDFIWNGDNESGCIQILKDTNIAPKEWQIGTTKVFIRHPETIWMLETERENYWHNMAQRIQTSWHRYVALRNAKATKIQRVWRQKRKAFELVKFREHGDHLLGDKKERRRFSICSQRTFSGDYLGINAHNKQTPGYLLREAAAIGGEPAVFSSKVDFLVPRAMRSARPMVRQMIVTKDHICIVEEKLVEGLVQHVLVTKAPIASVRDLAMSPYQDGWAVVHLDNMPDLVLNCDFKTELLAWLNSVSSGRINLQVLPAISYRNKNMKSTQIKFSKNEAAQRATFEKKMVQICSGLPAGTRSQTVRARSSSNAVARPRPQQQQQQQQQQQPRPSYGGGSGGGGRGGAAAAMMASAKPANGNGYGHERPQQNQASHAAPRPAQNGSAAGVSSGRRPSAPPPPPPPAAAPQHPQHRALFDFSDTNTGMLSLETGKLYEIVEKNNSGWWLGKRGEIEGWIPSNYLSPDPEPSQSMPPGPPPAVHNGGAAPAGDVNPQQLDSMAQLAAALASRSPSAANTPTSAKANVPARPGMNRFTQDDSDGEEAWE